LNRLDATIAEPKIGFRRIVKRLEEHRFVVAHQADALRSGRGGCDQPLKNIARPGPSIDVIAQKDLDALQRRPRLQITGERLV
jgi:hypothetical protein